VTVASRWTLQRNEVGKPIAFLEINNDITELKKTEAALQEAHDQLEKRVEERTAQLKKTNRELQRLINERRRLEKEILEISGKEQRRIGQDLHDGLSQLLTGIALMGKVLEQRLVSKSLPEASQLKKIVELVNQAVTETRGLARGLYPVELESNGLMAALQDLASNTEKLYNVSCHFHCDRPILMHDYDVATHLYRIAQEAVNNAVKHGQPNHVWIQLSGLKDRIALEIKDDGQGIPRKLNKSKGMGLRIMEYRAEMINAFLDIHRGLEKGTIVKCVLQKKRFKP
jgi:signal transduction histidine kinase